MKPISRLLILSLSLALPFLLSAQGSACSFAGPTQYLPSEYMLSGGTTDQFDWSRISEPEISISGLKRGIYPSGGPLNSCYDLGWFYITLEFPKKLKENLEEFGLVLELVSGEFPEHALPDFAFVPDTNANEMRAQIIWIDRDEMLGVPLNIVISAQLVAPDMTYGPKYVVNVKAPRVYRKID